MELTWVAAASLVFVGVGYAFVQRAPRPRFVRWSLVCASLFALATRDLFRPRERGPPATEVTETEVTETEATTTDVTTNLPDQTGADERRRTPLLGRLRSRIVGWFN